MYMSFIPPFIPQDKLTADQKKEQEEYFITMGAWLLKEHTHRTGMSLEYRLKSLKKGFKIIKELEPEVVTRNEEFKTVINNWIKEIERVRSERLEEIRTNIEKARSKEEGKKKKTRSETKETKDEAVSALFLPAHTTHVIQPQDFALKPYLLKSAHEKKKRKESLKKWYQKRKESWEKWHQKHGTYNGGRKRRRKTKKRRRKTRRKTRKRKTNKKRRRKPKKKHY